MGVGQGIKDRLALPAVFDQLALLEGPELVGYGRLGHVEELGDVTYAHLGLKQDVQNFDAGGVAKNFKELGQIVENLIVRHGGVDLVDDLLVGVNEFTALDSVFILHGNPPS